MGYFYGMEHAPPEVLDFYGRVSRAWCAETCAPRMRSGWTRENAALGQCSVTAFLAQDVLGGEVYGVPLDDGNFHCFNVIDGETYDFTVSQFKNGKLNYSKDHPQHRNVHFAKEEKKRRYELLKQLWLAQEEH